MRGSGRIFQRKGSSSWWCAYYLRGKEYRESTQTPDEKKALKFLRHRLKEVGADEIGKAQFVEPKQRRVSITEMLDALEADYRLRRKDTPQFQCHLAQIRDVFGTVLAADLTAEAVDRYIQERLEDGAAPATINRSTQLLSQAFRLAIERRHLVHAPAIRRLSERGNARQGFFSESEFRTILRHLPNHVADFALFAYLTAWRKGEIASLRWEDVDADVIRLRPEHSKNGEGRTVPITGELTDLMDLRRRARQVETERGVILATLVFHNAGQPIVDFRKSWRTACKFANCPGKLFHDLRRTSVRNMVRAGVYTDVARSISGHKTASVFSRYNIVAEDQKRSALEQTQGYLRAIEKKATEADPKSVQ